MARGRKVSPRGVADSEGGAVRMPGDMTPHASAKWLAIVPLIEDMTTIRETDVDALRQYCEACCLRTKAMLELEDKELILITPNGAYQTNPLLKVIAQAESVMMKLSERFGLDPTSRKRLQIAAKSVSNPFMDYLKGGRKRAEKPSE